MKALVGAFNQEKALVGAFSVIVQSVVETMDRFTALDMVQCMAGTLLQAMVVEDSPAPGSIPPARLQTSRRIWVKLARAQLASAAAHRELSVPWLAARGASRRAGAAPGRGTA